MPERPDLEYVVPILARELTGKSIVDVSVESPVVLRVTLRESPADLLRGAKIAGVSRRAQAVILAVEGARPLDIVVVPMLAGRFSIDAPDRRRQADLAISFSLSDGRELRYRDEVQMGKVYVIDRGQWTMVPGLANIGVDVLDPAAFTREAFRAMAAKRRDQAKVFLMDKSALDAMGNAYADEVLFEAKVHPKRIVRGLSAEEIDAMHDAIVKVIGEASREVARRARPIDEKVRDFLKVRNRHGSPCPRCGTAIRKVAVHGHDAFFCPACQPDKGKGAIDFRRAGTK